MKPSGELEREDIDFLHWIYDRLHYQHGENTEYDYMIRFKAIINAILIENEKKTSEEWCTQYSIKLWEDILDPDGWDRDDFQNSFYNEKISLYDFTNRIFASTCNIRIEKHEGIPYWFVGKLNT